ncbi:MAG: acyl-CoA dehydrogenase domain protein [Frankiales bacterium]|nr:acyl-CoA dehydrogenase domain protein [Frankiales bacterium]
MDVGFALTEEQQALRDTVRQLVADEVTPYAAAVDERATFPQEAYDALRGADLHAVHVPQEFGGNGADALSACLVIEQVARGCASSSLIPAVNKLGSLPVLLVGTQAQKERWLRPLAEGTALFCYALSEREAGSDVASMRTRATLDGDTWVLDGTKCWITNAGEGDSYTVFAKTDPDAPRGRTISAFLVARTDPGVSFDGGERKLGIKGSPTREVRLDGVRLPADRLLGERGDGMGLAMRTLDHTRVTIAAQALGIAQGALDLAASYVQERAQVGTPVRADQGVQFMLADMAMKLEAARALTYLAACKSERGDADLTYFSAACKCVASDAAMAITIDAVQLLGGDGCTRDFPAERMMRDAKITQIYEGTNQVQRIVLARELLKATR